jgi:hypothetical protein
MVVRVELAVTFGRAFTVRLEIAGRLTQPVELVPTTVYVWTPAVFGVTIENPLERVYIFAPLGVSVKLSPKQMAPLFTVTVGVWLTVTETVGLFMETQPFASVPIKVYTVVLEGFKTKGGPFVIPPGSSVKVVAPEVIIVTGLPEHTNGGFTDRKDTTGGGMVVNTIVVGLETPQVYTAETEMLPLAPTVAVKAVVVLVPVQPPGKDQV